jgi:hypothetical protein
MSKTNADDWAFLGQRSLTKREYFAALALQGFLSGRRVGYDDKFIKECIDESIKATDLLIVELNKGKLKEGVVTTDTLTTDEFIDKLFQVQNEENGITNLNDDGSLKINVIEKPVETVTHPVKTFFHY